MINLSCLLICILCKEKNRSLVCISSKQRIFWCWIHSFSVCQQILKKTTHCLVRWTAKYVFFVGEAIKKAVSFSKFMCLYAMLLLWDNLKHGFLVAQLGETIFIKVSSGCLKINYIRKLSKRISASSSKGVKFLIK